MQPCTTNASNPTGALDTSSLHAAAYSQAKEYYEKLRDIFYSTRLTILERVLGGIPKDATILDVGSGIGANLDIMHNTLGFKKAKGVDIAPEMAQASPFSHEGDYEIDSVTPVAVTFAQAFIHLFPFERAVNILCKMLRTTSHRIYLSTTVHDVESEQLEEKEGTAAVGSAVTRFRHRYSEAGLLKLIRIAIQREYELNSSKKWMFHIYHMKDPLEKLWFNVVLFQDHSIPPYLQQDYEEDGFILIRGLLSPSQIDFLKAEAERLKRTAAPTAQNILRYQQRDTGLFDRVENFLPSTTIESEIFSSSFLRLVASCLHDKQCCIFKDKLNYKPPKFGAFPAHQDAAAGWTLEDGRQQYLTVAIAIDPTNLKNGTLQVVPKMHKSGLLTPLHSTFSAELEASLHWQAVELSEGECLIFDAMTPHRSSDNLSPSERRLLLITYQRWRANARELREKFFADKRRRQPTIDDHVNPDELVKDSFGKWVRPNIAPNGAQ